ncbi:MAG: NAD(P)-binding protein [Nannocystaceae bacterium]
MTESTSPAKPEKIVIIGGGMSALTTAFELTSLPDWRSRYDITVYQMGHRLGGKGASGRNKRRFDRIEEHGLHLFYGFYDNAFSVLRRCYAELGRPAGAPLATLEEAFHPHSLIVFEEERGGTWQHQPLLFPRNDEAPGLGEATPTPAELIPRMLRFLLDLFEEPALRGARRSGLALRAIRRGVARLWARSATSSAPRIRGRRRPPRRALRPPPRPLAPRLAPLRAAPRLAAPSSGSPGSPSTSPWR